MYRMKFPLLFAAAVLAAAPVGPVRADAQASAASAAALDSVRALLRPGTFQVDVMDVAASPRLMELTQKLQAAIRADPAWFQEAVSRAAPGRPLPYDARLGLTEPEYREYLRLASTLGLHKVTAALLTVRQEGGHLVLDGGVAFPDLTGIKLDPAADELTTPLGVIRGSEEVHSDGERAAIGAWDGRRWRLEQGSVQGGDAKLVDLSLGRLRENGRAVFYWQMHEMREGQPPRRMVRIFYFDPPR
jgi:hypothetical protein